MDELAVPGPRAPVRGERRGGEKLAYRLSSEERDSEGGEISLGTTGRWLLVRTGEKAPGKALLPPPP